MNENQGLYKFKNTTYPKIYDNGYIKNKIVKLKDNQEGYSYIVSTPSDMIKSIGKNIFPGGEVAAEGNSFITTVDSNDVICVNSKPNKIWTANGTVSSQVRIAITEPVLYSIVFEYVSGTITHIDGSYRPMGSRICKRINVDGTSTIYSQSFGRSFPLDSGTSSFTFEITEDDIENGVNEFEICLWNNGSGSNNGRTFDDYKCRIMVCNRSDVNTDFEPYKETTKVCDNHGHCYCMTYVDGTVYSENGNEISVDYPKSLFSMKFRSISDRLQNVDGSDIGKENQKILFFGDSITAGYGANQIYHMWLSRYTGWKCINWGIGGDGYVKNHSGTGPSGEGVEGKGNMNAPHDTDNNIISMMQAVGDFENCFIAAGTNDYGAAIDIDVFRTAVRNTLDYAQTKASRIMVLTPVRRSNFDNKNSKGYKLHDYSGVIIEECMLRGIPCVDGYDIGMNPDNEQSKSWYYSAADGVHPSDKGHKFIAMWLLDKFKAVFSV